MKTTLARPETATHDWKIVDATDQILGRLAVTIANALRGRNKPIYTPHVDTGDYVIVINADKVKLTGSKEEQKKYMFYSGYMGGEKYRTVADFREKRPIHHYQRGQGNASQKQACERNAYQTQGLPRIRTSPRGTTAFPPYPIKFHYHERQGKYSRIHWNGSQKDQYGPGQNQGRNRQLRDQWSRPSRILQNRAAKKNRRLPFGHRREDEQRGCFGQCFGRRRCRSSRSHQARSLPGLGKNGS